MLVEINLLPQREPKKIVFLVVLSSLLAIMALVGMFYFWQIHLTSNEIASLDRQITMTEKVAETNNKQTITVESQSSVSKLKSAIDWANNYPIQTIPVMRELTSLLPERGFIQNFGYTEDGTVILTVQFDSAIEAAYFLNSLNKSEWVTTATLNSLNAVAPKSDNSTGNSNSSQTEQPVNSNIQPNPTENSDNAQPDNSEASQDAENNPANTAAINPSIIVKNKDNLLPRYLGQYDITLNKDYIKKEIKESKETEEGVTGS